MTTLSNRGISAARRLVATSVLSNHPYTPRIFDLDRHSLDIDAMNDWNWSSGERVLISLLSSFGGYGTGPTVEEFQRLDDDNRRAAVDALRVFLVGEEVGL